MQQQVQRSRIRVLLETDGSTPSEWSFTRSFTIGRSSQCEVQVDSGLVSRVHAEVVFEEGRWWVRDLDSTNGLFVDGQKTRRAPLEDQTVVQLGRNAPTLRVTIEEDTGGDEDAPVTPGSERAKSLRPQTIRQNTVPPDTERKDGPSPAPDRAGVPPGGSRPSSPDPSLSQVIARYFDDASDRPAGEHTRMIRMAYAAVKKKQQRRYTWVIVGILVLFVSATGYAIVQTIQNRRLEQRAAELFMEMKQQDLMMAKLRQVIEEEGSARLEEQLDEIEAQRERMAERYDGYVKEFGIYRRLSEEDRLIYKTARIFNESEFTIPAGFIREVKTTIRDYWTGPGRGRYVQAVRRAEENGYTKLIVETMLQYGLPPEFYYLALQESDFIPNRVGPPTRWGRAKGMWQFIPSTARLYGLDVGERTDLAFADPQDERLDPVKATDAAARYLLYIYSTAAQASGLLVMASYNWGEHRVIKKLEDLPNAHAVFDVAFADIPEDPDARTYWRFLTEYESRMPEETKDYVLKIFSAAVIGQDPRRFGFDFDNPLLPYMDRPAEPAR